MSSRTPGLSAMLRVKDEAEYMSFALRSIYPWVDEIVIAVQGRQSDNTWQIAQAWGELDKVSVYHFPHESYPNGPGHDNQPKGVHERSYFYNWVLDKTTRTHAMKWDGDMVALDHISKEIKGKDYVRFEGAEIVSLNPMRVSASHPVANIETRIFPVGRCRYVTGTHCEVLDGQPSRTDQYTIRGPAYLHFKWCKSMESITNAWPEGWESIDHFRRIRERGKPGRLYSGPMPSCMK